MLSRGRTFVGPAYLFACLVLGGSAQGIWQNMLLQLAGIAILAWAALGEGDEPPAPATQQLLLLAGVFIFVVLLQLIPLPPSIWAHLGPRKTIADEFGALGLRAPGEPLSLTPGDGLTALFGIIPPLALFCAMVRLKAYRSHLLAIAVIAGAIAGTALGVLQVSSSDPELSPWYLYEDTNLGKAVGFFANADHMASLLVITIPFLAAIVRAGKHVSVQRYSAVVAVVAAIAIIVVVGIALNGSLAGYGLALPVIAASGLILVPRRSRLRWSIVAITALLMIGSIAALEATPIGSGRIGAHAASAVQSRGLILSTTLHAARDFMPFGSGLGSFQSVYRLYERPEQVTPVYVVHAHNDYTELALELGIAGILLMLTFLLWWVIAVWRIWRRAEARPFARAASIASAAILIHSLVDFPLRTTSIAVSFAMCLALLADSRTAPPNIEEGELRLTRHLVI